jgi:hypothetical protein
VCVGCAPLFLALPRVDGGPYRNADRYDSCGCDAMFG